jgi:hypothetical protein
MLHVPVISPPDFTAVTVGLLQANPAVTHLWVSEGSARKPHGDVVSCDVAREAATGVIGRLRELGLSRDGAIVVERLDPILSAAAERAERDAPGEGADALIWEELEQNAGEKTRLSVTYLAFMAVAMLIASIGVLLDQPILDHRRHGGRPRVRTTGRALCEHCGLAALVRPELPSVRWCSGFWPEWRLLSPPPGS